jgi:curved DNA-binding protein CbpA
MAATLETNGDGFINFYKVLGLNDLESNKDIIKQAYHAQIKIHHPDKGGNKEQFQQIKAAYDILSNENRNKLYKTEFCLRQQQPPCHISFAFDYKGEGPALKIYTHQVSDFRARFHNPSHGSRYMAPTRADVFVRGFTIRSLYSASVESSQFDIKAHSSDQVSYFQISCKESMFCDKDGLVIGMFSLDEGDNQVTLTLINETFDPEAVRKQLTNCYETARNNMSSEVPTWFRGENIKINKEIFVDDRLKARQEIARLGSLRGPFSSYGAQEKIAMIEKALAEDSKTGLLLALEHKRLPIAFNGITAFNNFQADDEAKDVNNSKQNSPRSAPS